MISRLATEIKEIGIKKVLGFKTYKENSVLKVKALIILTVTIKYAHLYMYPYHLKYPPSTV